MNKIKKNEVNKLERFISEIIEILKSGSRVLGIICLAVAMCLFFFPGMTNDEAGEIINAKTAETCAYLGLVFFLLAIIFIFAPFDED